MTLDITTLFVNSKQTLIQRVRRLVGCPAIAQDIVHDSFEILSLAANTQAIARPLGFLHRTAINLALDHIKHERIVARHAGTCRSEYAYDGRTPERIIAGRERVVAIERALAELAPLTEQVFLRVKLEGWSYRQAGAHFQLTPRQVERHLLKAMLHCRARVPVDTLGL